MNQYLARYEFHADYNDPQVPILNMQTQHTEYWFGAKNDKEAIRLAKEHMDSFKGKYLALDSAKLEKLWKVKPVDLVGIETSKNYDRS